MQGEQIFRKILVPVDGSVPSIVARELAGVVAKKFNSQVTVIYVVAHELMSPSLKKFTKPEDRHEHPHVGYGGVVMPPPVHAPEVPSTPLFEKTEGEITNVYRQEGESAIAEAIDFFNKEGVPADQRLVIHADPAGTILNEAEKEGYDLIVMGSSGEEEQGPHLGSIAKKVSHRSKAPVLIARGKRQISKILAPVDGSANAEKALQYAVQIAKKARANITLLYVQESGIFRLRPEVSKEIGNRILSQAAAQVKDIKVEQKLESGDPAKAIIKVANKEDYDIIVMGSRGHGVSEMLTLGSVSDHVVQYADRSVLITK
jgi:nucleotide-binding universal stress UspA family protein